MYDEHDGCDNYSGEKYRCCRNAALLEQSGVFNLQVKYHVPDYRAQQQGTYTRETGNELFDEIRAYSAESKSNSTRGPPRESGGVKYDRDAVSSIKQQIKNAADKLNAMDVVAKVKTPDLSKMNIKQQRQWAESFLKSTGYVVDRKSFGKIEFTPKHINEGLNYVNSPAEVAAFAALPRVLKRGIEIDSHVNHKGRQRGSVTIAAPVEINGVRGNMAVAITITAKNHYHAHRLVLPDGSEFTFDIEKVDPTPAEAAPNAESSPIKSTSESRITDSNGKVKASRETDAKYMAAVESGDMVTAQKMVDEAARKAGYSSEKIYHGTNSFGFTKIKTTGVEPGVEWSPFFATNNIYTAMTYSGSSQKTEIGKTKRPKKSIIGLRREAEALLSDTHDATTGFIRANTAESYIDRYGSIMDEKSAKLIKAGVEGAFAIDRKNTEFRFAPLEEGFSLDDYKTLSGNYSLYANTKNFLIVDGQGKEWNRLKSEYGSTTRTISKNAEEDGYSGVLIKNVYDTGMDWDGNVDEDVELASDVYIFFSPEAQVKSADPVTYDDNGDVIPLSKRFNSKNEDIRYSLEPVKAIQPKNSEWERSSTTDEVRAKHPNLWAVDAESSESRNPTQISGTVRSYRKIYDALKAEDFNGTVLDASSGLGYGTRAGVEEYGFKVDDIEPFPDSTYKPKYTDYSKLNKKYDVIISNAVLNVLPQDQRDALVVKMGQMLNDGGRIFINVRGDDVRNASSKVAINEDNMEYFISNTGSYQKGFTKKELTAYLQDALGDEFTVVPTSKFGKVSAVVTKKEHVITLDNDYKGDISPESGSLRFSLEENENIKAKSMAYFRKNRDDISHISQKQLESANEIVDEMVDYMKPYLDKANNKGKRYLPEEILGDTRFQNGSYGRTIENTTICFRTLAYIDFTNDIKERIGRPLTVEESFLASQMLYDIAKEPQCLYCYVSLDRKAYDEFLLKYIEQRDGIVEKINALSSEDKDAAFERVEKYEAFRDRVIEKHNAKEYKTDKERNAAIKKEIETYIKKGVKTDDMFKSFLSGRKPTQNMQERYNSWVRYAVRGDGLISAADLTTEEKRSKIKADGGVMSEQVADAESYAQSASWAKKLEQYRAYNGEILSMSNDMVETLNSEYGLRFYSFSEYTPAFIVENMQQIRDASLKGFKGLAYTKKPDFARIFAPTGMNINISVFGRMDGGKVVPDTLQGADWAEVQELRKQCDNVGAVFVATTDEMVDWALEQDWIDVVIPFHIVRTGANVAEFYKWINHTSQQSDRVRKSNGTGGKKADITPPEHNNDYETYKKLIEKRKLVPRFEKWYKDPRFEGAKYMKLVNETRQPASKTPKLKPNFDKSTLEAAKKSFNTFVDEGGYYGDWYEEGVDYNEAVNTVVNDINRGVRANEVEYGRQDVDWTKAMENRGKNRQHGQKLSREVTAENYKTAEKYFGTTYNIREAGYICPDGKMLDFSGRHDGGPGGYRTVDHRELADALGVDYGGKSRNGGMIRFINEGNIRIVPEKGGIDLSVAPTEAQRHMLARYVASFRGEVILDIGDADGNAITSVEYPKDIPASFVLKDIDGYFDKGKVPEPFTSGVKYSRDTTVSYDYSKPFAEQVDDWIAGKIPKSDTLIVSGTPKVFAGIGMPSLPFTINSTHVDYALNGAKDFDHELGEDLLKQLPEAIKKPVAIMTSKTKASASVVAMLEIRHNGKQVVVPVSVTGFGYQNGIQIDSNAITSIYGKRYSIANVLRDAIQEESNGQFRLYYLNEKKATELLQVAKVPMPKMPATRNGGFIHSLTEANSPVKLKIKDATESQQFKRWFGKSKIVNADGTPRVVYHQMSKVFTVFNTDNPVAGANDSETPNGIFFKQNDHDIGIGGDIQMAVYLRMEKPLHFKNRKEANAWYVKNIKGYGKLQDEMNVALAPIEKEIDKLDDKYFMDESISEEEYDSKWNTLIEKMRETENGYRGHLRELLNDYFLTGESGYDGIELDYDGHRYVNGEREDVHTYIVFDGTQVKSATDNIGTYDRNNSDINYSREPETLNELRRQNRMLRERVDYWKGQTKPAKEKTLNKNDVHKLAMQLKEIEPTDLKTSEIEIRLNQLGRYILNTKEIRFTDVAEMAEDLAWDIVDNMSVKTEAPELELHNDIKSYMQSIVMHDDGSSEYRDIRRRYKNKRYFRFDTNKKRFEKSSLGVDSVYAELQAIYGEGLFPSDIWNVYDQLEHIAEVLDRTKGSYVDENNPEYQERQYYAADAVEMLRNSIIDGMLSEDVRQTAPTYAEKADAKLAKQKYEDSQKLKQAKAEGGQKLAEQKTEYDKLLEAQRKELNDRREREVKDVRDAKDKQIARIRKARDEKITRLIDENDERIKAALKKERKRSAKVLQEYRQRVENRDAKREENAERTKYKKRIEQDVKALSDWLLKPDHKNAVKHIPGPLQETVKEFIGSIDFTSKRALKGGAATKADMKYISKLEKLYNYVTDQNVSGERYSGYLDLPPTFENDLNLYIARVNSLARANNGIYTINQMTADELEQLSKIVKTIRKAITDMNKFYQNAVFQHAYEAGASDVQTLKKYVKTKAFTSSLATSRLDQTVMWKQSRPVHVFSRFGEGGKSICQEFIDGQNKFAFLMKETIDFANETYTSKEAQKWGKESHTFEFGDEQDPEYVTLTTPQIMSLYMLNQRDAGRQHLETGGLIGATHKGKGGKLVQDSGTHKLGQAEIHEICQKLAKLDAQDGGKRVEVAEKLQKFMAETGGEWGNWVSVKRFDVEMSKDKNYFPIEVYNAELNTSEVKANDSTNLYQLLNMGFTKELSPKANQAVVLSSIFDVFANHMSQMAQYRCFALPVLDTMKWLNYSERNASGEVVASLKNEMRRAFGTDAQNNGVAEHFITHFVQAISGTEGRGDNSVNVRTLNRVNRAAVAYNTRVMIQQPSAIVRAALYLNPVDLAAATKNYTWIAARKNIEEMQKYSGIAVWKDLGFYDVNVSRGLQEMIKHDQDVISKANEVGMKGAELMDRLTWAAIWGASKKKVSRETELTGEEYYKKVAEVFDEVIYNTQVVDSPLTKSEFSRDKSFANRLFASFMSEPMTTMSLVTSEIFNIQMKQATGEKLKASDYKRLSQTITVVAIAAVVNSALAAIIDAWRDDDDYATFKEKWLAAWKAKLVDELNPLTYFPIASTAWDFAKSLMDTANMKFLGVEVYGNNTDIPVADIFDQTNKALEIFMDIKEKGEESKYTKYGGYYKVVSILSKVSGIPAYNIMREISDANNNLFPDHKWLTYDAGETSNIKYAFEDGYLTEEEAIEALQGMSEDALSADEAWIEVNKWKNGNDSGTTSDYVSVYDAIDNDGDIRGAVKDMQDHGKEDKDIKSALTRRYKDAYIAGDATERAKIRKALYATGLYGSANDVVKKCNDWLKDDED